MSWLPKPYNSYRGITPCVLQKPKITLIFPQLSSRLWQVMHNRDPRATGCTFDTKDENIGYLFTGVKQTPPDSCGNLVDPLRVENSNTDSETNTNSNNGHDM